MRSRYLCEKYDKDSRLMPADTIMRSQVRVWMSASEGTFLTHALAIMYGSGAAPESAGKLEDGLAPQVYRDFDWLGSELKKGSGKFLVGDHLTVADTMMGFTIAFILKIGLGTKGKEWPAVSAWLTNVESTPTYQQAVKKTGHTLG
jgi:glutathione S-transferase